MASRNKNRRAADGITGGGFLKWISLPPDGGARGYPWSLAAVRHLGTLELHPRVTFFIGENGTGKSTLIEAVAQRAGFPEEGGSSQMVLEERWSDLTRALEIVRGVRREKDGFFLRAESYFNTATRVVEAGVNLDFYGGRSPHHQSHGESFLALAVNRFSGDGLYILDEPEAALSPTSQLALLRIIHAQVRHMGSQFIIATHSPILMAYPDAQIFQFAEDGVTPVAYEDTEHVRLYRHFLCDPDSYFHHLLSDD
jgi:predicted ATPase